MLIILSRETTDGAPQLRSAIAGLLKEEAVVLSKEPLENLAIKDLDEDTSKEDVLEALQTVAGEEHGIAPEAVKSLRAAYGGTRTAAVTLTASVAKNILAEHGKIKIGWVNCRIRRVERPMKCFNCWHCGHLSTKCTSAVDRSRVCIKCADDGHKAEECKKKELRCALCTENGNLENCPHVAGSTSDKKQRNFKVLQLNINHWEDAHDLLMQTVRELKPDLVMISEPYRHLGTQSWITDASGTTVIWACGNRSFQNITRDSAQEGFIRAKRDGIHFYNCYVPPSLTFDEFTDFLDRLTEDVKEHFPVTIAGDFNAWAIDWGSKKTNPRGQTLLEAMSSLDVVLLNSGEEPTFVRGEKSSIVDLTFMSSTLAKRNYSWRVSDIYTASDHRAILWEIFSNQKVAVTAKKTNSVGWRVGTFDPGSFSVALYDHPIAGVNATAKALNIMRKVSKACDATMTRKRTTNRDPPVYWWNETIAVLRKECNAARRSSERHRERLNFKELEMKYRKARRKLSKAIKHSKRQCWSELLAEVENDPWGRPYKVVMTQLKS
ncbi:uncharacterized protein [Fopius arisanus]|uniref:CCHC-type domain-containing protein n=1 Tax=Fopius arisanus TaxID=64838 RepID=A0A9R1TIT7_9HYME|nr:PREDICTED: uncharacterized protein LOC105270500 [Fopius arisanus]